MSIDAHRLLFTAEAQRTQRKDLLLFKIISIDSVGFISMMLKIDFVRICFYLNQGFSLRPPRLCGE